MRIDSEWISVDVQADFHGSRLDLDRSWPLLSFVSPATLREKALAMTVLAETTMVSTAAATSASR